MLTGHPLKFTLLLAASGLLAGCAQPGPFAGYRTSMGTLKASVSHLESENDQLRQEVDRLKADNREIENRLVQEESVNGDLAARLDDAKNLLRSRAVPRGEAHASNPPRSFDEDPASPIPARPAGQTLRKRRKPPSVQIPGQIETTPPAPDDVEDPAFPAHDSFGSQSRFDDPNRWLPVARGISESSTKTR